MKHINLILFLFFSSLASYAQDDGIPIISLDTIPDDDLEINEDIIEDYISNQDDEADFDLNDIIDVLEGYKKKPLNLNKATAEDLSQLRLLSNLQINDLINYRIQTGDFLAIYELQAIPSFYPEIINKIKPYVTVKEGLDDYNLGIHKMLYKGTNTLYLRTDRVLEKKKGYITPEPDPDIDPLDPEYEELKAPYLGGRNKYVVRFRHQYETTLSYGFTLENDPGEELFTGSNKSIPFFDFGSAHIFLKDYNKTLKGVALGDFAVNMGQGLIMFDGFGSGKSSFVMDVKKSGRPLRPYTSISESLYKRGAGINLTFGDHFEVMAFGSYKGRDANISLTNEDDDDLEILQISSLQTSGNHRTEAEIEDKNSIKQLTTGGTIKYKTNAWHIAANATMEKLSSPLQRTYSTYNQFNFNGDQLLNASLDYSWVIQNFNFFGETAMSDNGGIASMNGLIIGLDRNVAMSVVHRYYGKDYQALMPNVFAETSSGNNETGLYLGLEIKPNKHWIISTYFDAWKHPWLRSGVDAPSKGNELFARVTYKRKRKMNTYVQFRREYKEKNAKDNITNLDYLADTYKTQVRLHISNKINKSLELRNRAEFSLYENGTGGKSRGYMLMQDWIFKPIGFPLSFTGRFAIFQTDDYDSRIYAYENDILYSFYIPPYYNTGTRFYINLRYKGIRNMTMELRYAQTYYADQDTFGSGNEEINKPRRSEIKAQIKYKF